MLEIGELVANRYRIKDVIGEGGANLVWLARDEVLERDIALKQRNSFRADDYEPFKHLEVYDSRIDVQTVFKNEARMLARLEHPHLLPIYDYGHYKDRPFLVMRFLPKSQTIVDYIDEHGLMSVREILTLTQRLASAIDYLHAQGITHGDINPANILLGEQQHPYIYNLVVSSALQAIADAKEENIAGTPPFMAPETYVGEPLAPSVDLFALGVMLYQMFTGELPLGEKLPLAIGQIRANQKGEDLSISVREHRPDLPIGLDIVINRLTRFDASERYASAQDAVDALNQVFYSGQGTVEGQIFISYARKDNDYVYTLARELRRIGLSIWIDQDISTGANWDKSIEEALKSCDKMLLIVSPASMLSENVQDEWSYFLEEGKAVFPFIYREAEMSFRLRRRQYISSSSDLLADVARIVDVLAGGNPSQISAEF
jgi:serine/threonine protein kinase